MLELSGCLPSLLILPDDIFAIAKQFSSLYSRATCRIAGSADTDMRNGHDNSVAGESKHTMCGKACAITTCFDSRMA